MVEATSSRMDPSQTEAIAFLGRAESHGAGVGEVERIETHGALVFLADGDVYKIKRAVRFSYMDFSTLEKRRAALSRELEINRPQAPDLYLGLAAVCRAADGALVLDRDGTGSGREVVEWVLHMRRFPADALLSRVADARGIDADLARDLADAVTSYHAAAAVSVSPPKPVEQLGGLIGQVVDGLAAGGEQEATVRRLRQECERRLEIARPILEARAASGFVRRCHGDLHLDNIVLWKGRPVLFDALEFDEALATIDTLYDLAFLLMDLERHNRRPAANMVLNRYLWRTQALSDLEGLAAMPLLMAMRAGIRAMVRAQRAAQAGEAIGGPSRQQVTRYLALAFRLLAPPPPILVAVGGVSGSGKSRLAAALAPLTGAVPGAVHLRSDLERKAMLGRGETDRLPPESYTAEMSDRVYDLLIVKARAALAAGHAVILDAAHLKPGEKSRAARLAAELSVPFLGLWLTAPAGLLRSRITSRTGDASDATVDVLERQLSWGPAGDGWNEIDASGDAAAVLSAARAMLPLRHQAPD